MKAQLYRVTISASDGTVIDQKMLPSMRDVALLAKHLGTVAEVRVQAVYTNPTDEAVTAAKEIAEELRAK